MNWQFNWHTFGQKVVFNSLVLLTQWNALIQKWESISTYPQNKKKNGRSSSADETFISHEFVMVAQIKMIWFFFSFLYLMLLLLIISKLYDVFSVLLFYSLAIHPYTYYVRAWSIRDSMWAYSFEPSLFTSDMCSKRNTHFICYGIANFSAESKVNQTGNDFDTHDVCDWASVFVTLFLF